MMTRNNEGGSGRSVLLLFPPMQASYLFIVQESEHDCEIRS